METDYVNESPETRKLAAVMFADLEGYTAMFQANEASAMKTIDQHRSQLHEIIAKHHGEIIHFYGDGSVTVFNSVIDAVQSAISLQLRSISDQTPLRIGIHMGDLIYASQDIFGDVVNVASRIQSVGVSGSIVVSGKVAKELDNHPEISLHRLGNYKLKNVTEDLELFAIKDPGLSLPPDKPVSWKIWPPTWMSYASLVAILLAAGLIKTWVFPDKPSFTEERLSVLPFENFTDDAKYDKTGKLAADWITTQLIESAAANVMTFQSSLLFSNGDLSLFSRNPGFARRTGCTNLIKGAFSFTGVLKDSLIFWASVVDVRTGSPLPVKLQSVVCHASDEFSCIQQMSNVIKGYWKSKADKVLSPPKYDAYKAYLEARLKWGGPNEDESKPHLLEAIRLDSSFLDPYFLLLDLFYNTSQPQHAIDTLRLIKSRFKDLNSRQANYLLFHEADLNGKLLNAWEYFEKELLRDPQDLMLNTSGMVMAMEYLNHPDKALELFEYLNNDSLDLNTCNYCRSRMIIAIKAHVAKAQYAEAGKLADRIKHRVVRTGEYLTLIEYYMATGDTSSVNSMIGQARRDTADHANYKYLMIVAAREAARRGNDSMKAYYASQAIAAYKGSEGRPLARSYYLKGDLSTALTLYENLLQKDPGNKTILGELGLMYARQHQTDKANLMVTLLEKNKTPYDFGETSYFQGRIKANLHEYPEAISYLSQSLEEGQRFRTAVTFQYDPDLMVLQKHPEFLRLLSRNTGQ